MVKTASLNRASDEIYVVDLETTGLNGGPKDVVVEIGVCRVFFPENMAELVYSSTIGFGNTLESNELYGKSWIFKNSNLKLSDLVFAPRLEEVMFRVKDLLEDKCVTSYNTNFDLHRFLFREPWNMKSLFEEGKDIMQAARVFHCAQNRRKNSKFPRLEEIYYELFPENCFKLDISVHRAASDAIAAARVMLELYRKGYY